MVARYQASEDNFYPRPHMEGDDSLLATIVCGSLYFYPRPHMEGDWQMGQSGLIPRYFYPRPHMEGD